MLHSLLHDRSPHSTGNGVRTSPRCGSSLLLTQGEWTELFTPFGCEVPITPVDSCTAYQKQCGEALVMLQILLLNLVELLMYTALLVTVDECLVLAVF